MQLVKALHPDGVMPAMDGLTTLKHIMRASRVPVAMVSSPTPEGATETVEKLVNG